MESPHLGLGDRIENNVDRFPSQSIERRPCRSVVIFSRNGCSAYHHPTQWLRAVSQNRAVGQRRLESRDFEADRHRHPYICCPGTSATVASSRTRKREAEPGPGLGGGWTLSGCGGGSTGEREVGGRLAGGWIHEPIVAHDRDRT